LAASFFTPPGLGLGSLVDDIAFSLDLSPPAGAIPTGHAPDSLGALAWAGHASILRLCYAEGAARAIRDGVGHITVTDPTYLRSVPISLRFRLSSGSARSKKGLPCDFE
jgi:hypothetical protein